MRATDKASQASDMPSENSDIRATPTASPARLLLLTLQRRVAHRIDRQGGDRPRRDGLRGCSAHAVGRGCVYSLSESSRSTPCAPPINESEKSFVMIETSPAGFFATGFLTTFLTTFFATFFAATFFAAFLGAALDLPPN
eukprot:256202-Prymnesium_polylepis.1